MTTQWRYVQGFSKYLISLNGGVKFFDSGMPVPQALASDGCTTVTLVSDDGIKTIKKVCRLVIDSFEPRKGEYFPIYHVDGNGKNNRLDNIQRKVEEQAPPAQKRKSLYVSLEEEKKVEPVKLTEPTQPEPPQVSAQKGRPKLRDYRPVRVIETGEVFPSVNKMAQTLGLDRSTVGKILRGEPNYHSHRGLTFEYTEATRRTGVLINETQEIFPTVRALAKAKNLSENSIYNCLRGKYGYRSVHGFSFQYVTEDAPLVAPKAPPKWRKRRVKLVETGQEFATMAECARFLQVSRGNMTEAVNRPQKTLRGYHIEFVDQPGG